MHLDTKSIVKRISGSLARETVGSGLGSSTGVDGVRAGVAAAVELRADEARDDVDVVGRAVVEVVLVDGSERIGVATVSLGRELDGWVAAVAEVEGSALLGGRGGVASILYVSISISFHHGAEE